MVFGGENCSAVKYYVNGEQAYFDVTNDDGTTAKTDSVNLSALSLDWQFKFRATAGENSAFVSSIDYVDAYVCDTTNPVRLTLNSATDSIAADGDVVLVFSTPVGSNARGSVYINGLPVEDSRVKVSGDMKTVTVSAPQNGYDSGLNYTLSFANAGYAKVLTDINGTQLARKGTTATFAVTGNKRDYMAYLSGISGVDGVELTEISPTIAVRNMTDSAKKYIFVAASYDGDGNMISVNRFQAYDIAAQTDDASIEPFSVTPGDGVALMRFYVWDNDSYEPIMRNTVDISVN